MMHQCTGRETVAQLRQQSTREPLLVLTQCSGVPLRAVVIVDGHEGRFTALRQSYVLLFETRVDLSAQRHHLLPLLMTVGLGDPRVLVYAGDLVLELEIDLGLTTEATVDGGGGLRLRRAGERDVTFPGEQARGRIEPDPASARDEDLGPGMQVGEILSRTRWPIERFLVRTQLHQIA